MCRALSLRDSVLLLTQRWLNFTHKSLAFHQTGWKGSKGTGCVLGGVVREMEKQHFMKTEGDR
jgi:hypothetical protein